MNSMTISRENHGDDVFARILNHGKYRKNKANKPFLLHEMFEKFHRNSKYFEKIFSNLALANFKASK